eukprot:gnl/MRDRNA2_/MRDRNA2_117446_c0_seq1.p1 gnl/MRDRNA2_/MRDRNA2_117446_c0~~gnl/MRDRNA2_/MRDRNA2_117446_c0_seq1.p1  ORF type:complete len:554 (-),score=77.96 gnl/MRDRNA2_/MRDRNA2_117446_c0_seq1:22-1683(-)
MTLSRQHNMQLFLLLQCFFRYTHAARVRSSALNSEQILKELSAAVKASDGEAVFHLTEKLRAAVPRVPDRETDTVDPGALHMARKPLGTISVASVASPRKVFRSRHGSEAANRNHTDHMAPDKLEDGLALDHLQGDEEDAPPFEEVHDSLQAQHGTQMTSMSTVTSIFDDDLFHLTAESKIELKRQLQQPDVAHALQFVKTGGWYNCAYGGATCICAGKVRYGSAESNRWSKAKWIVGQTPCNAQLFGDPAPGAFKECQCHRKGQAALVKNLNSVSLLQEAFIFLLRFLSLAKMLPLYGTRRDGTHLWGGRKGGGPPERYWIRKYIYEAQNHAPGGTCMDWDFTYLKTMFPGCTKKYMFKYEPEPKKQHVTSNAIYGDVYTFHKVIGPSLKFNFVIATQVFEHLPDPFPAAEALFRATAPGGVVIVTAPQQAQFHQVPHDYFRYTKEGLKYMLIKSGFCVPNGFFAGGGDFVFDIARSAGLQVQDFSLDEVESAWQVGYDLISDAAITIHALAIKPPHAWCQNATAGWDELHRRGIPAMMEQQRNSSKFNSSK